MNKGLFYSILDSWKGTPYRHNLMMKGAGVDCICFVVAVINEYYEQHHMPQLKVDFDQNYPSHWYMSKEAQAGESLLLKEVGLRPQNAKLRENKLDYQEGDLLLFKMHNCPAFHTAFYLEDKRIIHSISGTGVTHGTLQDDRWGTRHTYTFQLNWGEGF